MKQKSRKYPAKDPRNIVMQISCKPMQNLKKNNKLKFLSRSS